MSPNPPSAEHGGRAVGVAFAWFAAAWAVAALADVLDLVFFPAARFLWLDAFVVGGTAAGLPLLLLAWRRMAALGATEEQYRALFHAHPNPMWIYDADTYRFLEVNAAAIQQYGYSRDEFLAMGVLDIRAPEDREAVKRAIREDGAISGSVWRHLTKDGRLLEAEIASHRLRWRGHNARVTQARDVTERRRAQELVRQSEERLRLVLDSTGDGLYSVDLEENCLWCNPACARLLGFHSPEELIGRNIHALAHHTRANGEPYPIEACEMARAARAGQGFRSDDELLWRPDGSSFHAEYHSYPIWKDQAVEGMVVGFVDIERRRAAEQALRQSEERLRALSDSGVFGLAVGRHDGRLLEANDAYLNMMGYSRQDLEAGAMRWDSGTAPAFRDLAARASRRLRAGHPVPPWRSEMVRKDGSHVPVLVALVPQPDGALNLTLDLTQLQHTERSLKATERRYQLAGVAPLCLLAKSARKAAKFRRAARPRETNSARHQRSAAPTWGPGAPESARAQAGRAP
ncbi:MAG TPA: PAS domain S-box protein [Terriglobales bacterium]|nr:PAS domain S-box protein [Terriglobales bacterium]